MNSLGTSLILLILALVLLWLAVTDRLSRVLDAWDVITGKTTATASSAVSQTVAPLLNNTSFQLPSLPTLGQNAQVEAV